MPDINSSNAQRAIPVAVKPSLPNAALPQANWADSFEIETRKVFIDMKSLAEKTIGHMPSWARGLLKVRNILVAPFGLKSDGLNDVQDEADCIDLFPIIEQANDRIVLGLDDKHLDFRIVVERFDAHPAYRVRATTLVQCHNLFGRLYIFIITPFHRLIVKSVLQNAL